MGSFPAANLGCPAMSWLSVMPVSPAPRLCGDGMLLTVQVAALQTSFDLFSVELLHHSWFFFFFFALLSS